ELRQGGWLEIDYLWGCKGTSAQERSDLVVGLFVDKDGHFLMKDGVLWLHDIHESDFQAISKMKTGYCLDDRRLLIIPSDFPSVQYRLVVALQKNIAVGQKGWESFKHEFYERGGEQSLE